MSKTRISCAGLVLGASLALTACGGSGGKPAGASTMFHGTWVSSSDVSRRGSLRLDGTSSYGTISGTLTLDAGTPSEQAVPISGTETYYIGGGYTTYEFSGGGFSFNATLYGSLERDAMVGSYTSATDDGSWHTIVSDGIVEPTIEKAFALPTGWSVTDLCFAAGRLYATATPAASTTPALYEVNQDTGDFAAVVGAPADPAGIASDGSQFWISSAGAIETYDASWTVTGTLVSGLANTPSQLAYQGGAVWFVDSPLPFWPVVVKIDASTRQLTTTTIEPQRPQGIELRSDQLWIGYYPAGGEWAKAHRYDTSTGMVVNGFFAPSRSLDPADLMNGAGPLATQGTSFWMVSGPGLYLLSVP